MKKNCSRQISKRRSLNRDIFYLDGQHAITWTRLDGLAVDKIGFRQELWQIVSQAITAVVANISLEPFKQLPVPANKRLDLIHQHVLVNDLLCVQIKHLQELVINGLVIKVFLDSVKEFNFLSSDNRLV